MRAGEYTMEENATPLSTLIQQAGDGSPASRERLVAALYDRLRAMAAASLRD
jgi:hypothetical protein